ncbi:MAG: MaoC family dehydratase N-terminal domain-containing protein [Burkholderiales bacterium]|nr:MaoC family dehydratase N-terminal domain-containing protein [Burkholderiales bacterium]
MTSGPDSWREWIGRTERQTEVVTAMPQAALSATLDRDDPAPVRGSEVPPLWHWAYFMPVAKARDIGPDGHPKRGGFLPPVPLPRRMWAGGRLAFSHALRVGDEVTRTSRIADVTMKEGRSGTLVFVVVRHEYADGRGVAITEEHDIVYRDMPAAGAPSPAAKAQPARSDEQYAREIAPDPVLLFRYSAITFNGHRIHYDRSYVTGVEGYPGLIVHGPLIATLLLDNLRRHHSSARVKAFAFRAMSPLFDIHRFTVCGREEAGARHALWARNHEGALAMEATAELA